MNQGRGLALDAILSREKDEATLASSSLPETDDPIDLFTPNCFCSDHEVVPCCTIALFVSLVLAKMIP